MMLTTRTPLRPMKKSASWLEQIKHRRLTTHKHGEEASLSSVVMKRSLMGDNWCRRAQQPNGEEGGNQVAKGMKSSLSVKRSAQLDPT